MNLGEITLPRSVHFRPAETICFLSKLNWIECVNVPPSTAATINAAFRTVETPELPVITGKMNLGCRQRITLESTPGLPVEGYTLDIGHESIVIHGGSAAGVFYGAQSLAQLILVSSRFGGHERALSGGILTDYPKFSWRGIMLDSSRHFQRKEIILDILEHMARWKLNLFHWHLVDRQGWRLPLQCAPDLAEDMPSSRCYTFGSYTFDEIKEIRTFAAERHISIVPEIEMPGHSAAVFRKYPDLACQGISDPFGNDIWEYCIGNPHSMEFLKKIVAETAELFPESPFLHIGGDEAAIAHWEKCPCCRRRMIELHLPDLRALERSFMEEMARYILSCGKRPILWGALGNMDSFPKGTVIENWLSSDLGEYRSGEYELLHSYHEAFYFDYPVDDSGDREEFREKLWKFPIIPEGFDAHRILGGEGCVWTEQLPSWRVLARVLPRMRPLADLLWAGPGDHYETFLRRERNLLGSGLS